MKSIKKKKKKSLNIIGLIFIIVFTILTGLLIYNIIKLSNIENILRIIVIVVLILIWGLLVLFRRKKKVLCRCFILILCILYAFLDFTFYKIYNSLDNITKTVGTKGISLVTSVKNVKDISDIKKGDIAITVKDIDKTFYEMAEEIIYDKKIKNKLVEYEGYLEIINALINKEIDYAFLPENYNDIYNASNSEEEKVKLDFNVLYSEKKVIATNDDVSNKRLDEPISMLLMGIDVLTDSYNADTLMVLTINPKTMKVTMLSIPRDTYTTIACTGGKHKINSSGWYGDNCVVRTVENYLDIDIDYYAKINFLGIVDLVNNLGGVEVDVPYAFCEQNSKRQWGKNTVYVDKGLQTLNGEQALALSRNRHYWKGTCPAKYTSEGERSDLTRGQNQQLVIKAILSKLLDVRDINKFYGILDTVGKNMTTNMSRETILSFYNVGKEIVKRFNSGSTEDLINIEKLALKSNFATVHISGLDLSMIVNYKESVDYVSKQMKKNLGLLKSEVVKDFSFDINEEYDPDYVKYNKLTYSLSLFPSFVGKSLGEALSYCNRNGLKCESSSSDTSLIVTTQSIAAKTDITAMRNRTVIFGVNDTIVTQPEKEEDKPIIDKEDGNAGSSGEENTDNENTGNTDNGNTGTENSGNGDNETGNETPDDNNNNQEKENGDNNSNEGTTPDNPPPSGGNIEDGEGESNGE